MKSRILFFCFLAFVFVTHSFAQETSYTFSPVATVTAQDAFQQSSWGHFTFSSGTSSPNPVGTVGLFRYRTGVSFEITNVPSYAYITKADFIITVSVPTGSFGSTLAMNKLRYRADTYGNAAAFWGDVASVDNYSTVSVGTQTISSGADDDLTNDLRNVLTGDKTISMGFVSNGEESGTTTIVNIQNSPSLKVYYQNPGVTVKNNFGGVSTGTIKVDGSIYNSGVPFYWTPYEYHTAEAIDQSYNNHNWAFKEWRKNGSFYSSQRTVSINSFANQKETIFEAVFEMASNVIVRNSFDAGDVKVDGGTVSSGATSPWANGSTHTLEAIDRQYIQDPVNQQWYYRIYQDWKKSGEPNSIVTAPQLSASVTINGDATYTANFLKEFNTAFQNYYPGYGNGGVISVNGTQYNSPTSSFPVVQYQTITGGVVNTYQVVNGIEYIFGSWSPGGSTSATTTLTPGDHTTYTANFNAKPLPPPNISVGGPFGSPIQITWSQHPHSGVTQYQIWRIVKPKNENSGAPMLIATVNSSTTSYTDNDYVVTDGYTQNLLNYDVRAYFSVNGVYADPNYIPVFGGNDIYKIADGVGKASLLAELPESYAISNYPNPFNPSTTISYQLVEDASVQLRIYDVMGREVMTLVDAQKTAGYHSAQWNGKDSRGTQVSSGVYLYRFMANPINGNKPFITSGKLLLTK